MQNACADFELKMARQEWLGDGRDRAFNSTVRGSNPRGGTRNPRSKLVSGQSTFRRADRSDTNIDTNCTPDDRGPRN
jgi:hypothetical protein